jgi:hypothetical protein
MAPEQQEQLDTTRSIIAETKKLLKEAAENQKRLTVQLDALDSVIIEKYRSGGK